MDKLSSLSNANKTYINNLKNNSNNKQYSQNPNLELKPDSVELSTKKESLKKSKLALAIGVITASVATVLGCVYALKKTGKTDKLDDIAKNAFKLADVDFNDGIAKLKDGSNFTGVIDDVLKNGDKIKLEYTDGIIKKSTREGQKSFKKVYETINDEKIVTEIKDNVVDKINITTIQNSAKTQQEKLKNLLSNNSDLSIEDFKKQTDEIQFKSKEQKDKIDEIIKNKKEAEIKAQKAKEEAEAKLKAEAEAKAKEEAKLKEEAEAKAKLKEEAEAEIEDFKNSLNDKSYDELKELYDNYNKEYYNFVNDIKRKNYGSFDTSYFTSEEKIKWNTIINKQNAVENFAKSKRISEIVSDTDKSLKITNQHLTEKDKDLIGFYQDSYCGSNSVDTEKSNFLNDIFKKIEPTDDDCVLYRGIEKYKGWKKELAFDDGDFKPGKIITNPGITSTSYNPKSVTFSDYVMGDTFGNNSEHYVLRIHCKKGTKAIIGGGGEAILPPNNKMKVLSFNPITKVADVEYIPPTNL